ncbi:MAG: hypothetical protein WA735_07735, partial [Candidatus Acidiferrales bacterium]
ARLSGVVILSEAKDLSSLEEAPRVSVRLPIAHRRAHVTADLAQPDRARRPRSAAAFEENNLRNIAIKSTRANRAESVHPCRYLC